MQPRRQTLPILLLIKTAYQVLWQQRDDALRLGLVPTLLVFGGLLYGEDALTAFFGAAQGHALDNVPSDISFRVMALSVIVLAAICLLTVNWLRFLLLGPMGAIGIGLAVGQPHLRFLVAAIGLGLAAMAGVTVISVFLSFMPPPVALLGNLLMIAAFMVLAARFLPFLAGLAIGQRMSLAQSWNVSRGNGMAIAMSLILAQIPFLIGLTLLRQVLDVTGFSSVAPAGTAFIASVVQVADWLCQAGVVATAYRHLVGVRV